MSDNDELDGLRAKVAFLEDNTKQLTEDHDRAVEQRNAWRQIALGYANILRLEG